MSVGSAIQSALLRCIGSKPQEVFSSSAQECVLMADLVHEAATDIAKSHDWRALTKIHDLPGGAASYPLPADYDRMLADGEVDDPAAILWSYEPIQTVNEWMRLTSGAGIAVSPGGWIILGGEMQFYPTPSAPASFPYVSSQWARTESGNPRDHFESDDDTFVLSERLLTLSLIWRYKEASGLEYAEDQENYSLALGQEQGRDRGAYMLRSPRSGSVGARMAYSGRAFP